MENLLNKEKNKRISKKEYEKLAGLTEGISPLLLVAISIPILSTIIPTRSSSLLSLIKPIVIIL